MSEEKPSQFDESKSQYKRLKEIDNLENQLRHERAMLLRERTWYKKLSSWIGIIAIIVPVLLFTLNYFISQQKTQLTVSYEEPRTLVFFKASVRSRAKLLFDDKPVENIYRATIHITNTGTMAIDREHFKDGPIKFTVFDSEKKEGVSDKSNIPFLLDIVKATGAGQQHDVLQTASSHEPAKFTYLPSLLNPGESVELDIYLSRASQYKLSCQGKLLDGDIALVSIADTMFEKSKVRVVKAFGSAILNLFGSKWLSIIILVIALAVSAVMSLGLFAFGDDENWIWPNVLIFINGVVVCILFLMGIIVTTIY